MKATEIKAALAKFNETGAGALYFEGRWIFKDDLRTDAALAARFVADIG